MPTYPTTYLTVTEADTLAASVLGLTEWASATSTQKTNALDAATRLIDAGLRYQGRKYDPAQVLQFPRVAFDDGRGYASGATGGAAELVWDWDDATSTAVIPPTVQRACLVEADEILQDLAGKSQRWRRLDEQHQASPSTSPAPPPRPTARASRPPGEAGCPAARTSCWRRTDSSVEEFSSA